MQSWSVLENQLEWFSQGIQAASFFDIHLVIDQRLKQMVSAANMLFNPVFFRCRTSAEECKGGQVVHTGQVSRLFQGL